VPVTSVQNVSPGDEFSVRLSDGEMTVRVIDE
jgi:hypothetical protein